jgi:hypothetical protein
MSMRITFIWSVLGIKLSDHFGCKLSTTVETDTKMGQNIPPRVVNLKHGDREKNMPLTGDDDNNHDACHNCSPQDSY